MTVNLNDRILGGILGTAVGDALGVPVEFVSRERLAEDPVTGMRGFGTHNQPPGTWSDDTSMMLCLLEGLVDGKDWRGIADLFADWMLRGYWTPHGTVFDIGGTTREAILRFDRVNDPRKAGGTDEYSNGNGSLMRTLPVALVFRKNSTEEMAAKAVDASRLTHGHPRSCLACVIYCDFVRRILEDRALDEAWEESREWSRRYVKRKHPIEAAHFGPILARTADDWRRTPEKEIPSSGYVLHTLVAAIWCLMTTVSFSDCVLRAVNLGGDAHDRRGRGRPGGGVVRTRVDSKGMARYTGAGGRYSGAGGASSGGHESGVRKMRRVKGAIRRQRDLDLPGRPTAWL